MRDTSYATELATASIDGCRIERLFVKGEDQVEIRFSWWVENKMANRPLDLRSASCSLFLRRLSRKGSSRRNSSKASTPSCTTRAALGAKA